MPTLPSCKLTASEWVLLAHYWWLIAFSWKLMANSCLGSARLTWASLTHMLPGHSCLAGLSPVYSSKPNCEALCATSTQRRREGALWLLWLLQLSISIRSWSLCHVYHWHLSQLDMNFFKTSLMVYNCKDNKDFLLILLLVYNDMCHCCCI